MQILLLDIVFSLDSVITAVGMARAIIVMMAAMIIAVGVMLVFAGVVSEFVERHPSMKILALAFLLLIGVLLVADAFGQHIDQGLRLLRDGVLAGRRAAEHALPQEEAGRRGPHPALTSAI